MNNTERIFWLFGIFVLCFHALNQSSKINDLESANKIHELSSNIKSDQLLDTIASNNLALESEYKKGFEDGKTHAMIASIHGDHLYDYADGYHAAVAQFSSNKSDGLSREDLLNLFLESFDNNLEAEEDYLEIISDLIADQ